MTNPILQKATLLFVLSMLLQASSVFAQNLIPQNVTAKQTASGQVTVNWNAGTGAFECSEYNIITINLAVGFDSDKQVDCSKRNHVFNGLATGLWTFSVATRYTEEVCSINPDDGGLECDSNEESSPQSTAITVNVSDSLGFKEGDYTAYYGDINGDNIDDIYLKAREQFIPIHGDILIPLYIPTGDSYVLLSSPSGYQPLGVNNDINVNSLTVIDSVAFTDFNGDGLVDITVGQIGSTRFDITILASSGDNTPTYYAASGPMIIERPTHNTPASVSHDPSVGATAGNFNVGASGGASYAVPIQLPAGTAGLTPNLSLNYSSGAGNGLVGKGWNISGMSSITRCGQRNIYDNKATAIQWNADDRFCMNGTRLILKSGSYGAAGSTYTTEIENHVVITAFGGTLGSPDYFESVSRNGRKTRYGFIDGANEVKQITGGGIYRWARSHQYDLAENKITYHYSTAGNTFLLKEVRYAYGASNSYGYRVVYQYDRSREDTQARYVGSYRMDIVDRLNTISVQKVGGVELRAYELGYKTLNTSSSYYNRLSKLEEIKECAGAGINKVCLKPTIFTWSQDIFNYTGSRERSALFNSGNAWIHEWSTPDVNADGYQDLLIKYDTSRNRAGTVSGNCNTTESLYLGSASGLVLADTQNKGSCGSLPRSLNYYLEPYNDLNSDGRVDRGTDLTTFNGTSWNLGTENPLSTSGGSSWYMDINGDGLSDLVRVTYTTNVNSATDLTKLEISLAEINPQANISSNQTIRYQNPYIVTLPAIHRRFLSSGVLSSAYHMKPSHRAIGDFNGDGKLDIVVPLEKGGRDSNGKYQEFDSDENEETLFTDREYVIFDLPLNAGSAGIIDKFFGPRQKGASLLAGDINADGTDDLIAKSIRSDGDDMFIHYRITGYGDGNFIPYRDMYSGTLSLADYDQDGFLDFIGPDIYLWRGVEIGFVEGPRKHIQDGSTGDRTISGDFNGDGRTDYLVLREGLGSHDISTRPIFKQYNRVYVDYHKQVAELSNRITTITTGLGHTTEITYDNIAGSDHYVPFDINANGPTEIRNSICVAALNGSCQNRYSINVDSADDFYTRLNQGPLLVGGGTEQLNENYRLKPVAGGLSVVTSVVTSNPHTSSNLSGNVNTSAEKVNDYYYGRAFSRGARGFVGFETMTVVDRDAELETQRVYRQDFPFNGQAYLEQVRTTGGRILSTRYTDYGLNRPSNGAAPYFPYQVYPKQNITATHDFFGGSLLKVETSSISREDLTVEGFVKKRTATVNGQESESQTVVTDASYQNIDACRVRGAMRSETITSTRIVPSQTNTTSVLTKNYEYYENNADPKGRCGLAKAEITQPNSADQIRTETEYSLLGNPEKVTISAENSVPSVAARTTRRSYDPLGRFPVETFDAYDNKVETVNSYNEWGLPSNISDANGFTRTLQFDVFNRPTLESANDGSWSSTGVQSCQNVSCPASAITRTEARVSGGAYSYQYNDILGRVVRRATVGFDGRLVFVDNEYDSRGNLKLQSEPYYSGDNTSWNRYLYDLLGRATHTYLADGSESRTEYRGFDIKKINALDQTRQENYNALGELDEVIDHNGGRINNEYDALGNLIKATTHPTETDLDDVVITMGYDDLSRKLWMNDPDKGYWTYSYNAFGELYQQTNANLEIQTHSYDNNGRLLRRTDRRADGSVDSHTRWYFDGALPSGSNISNAIGHTSAVVHSLNSGVETCNTLSTQVCEIYNFDSLGRGLGMTRSLGENGQDGEYNTSLEYDAHGRVLKELDVVMSVNIESGVYHHYNQYGYDYALSDIGTGAPNNGNDGYEGVYEVLNMDARGQVTKSIRGNGVTSEYTYNPENGRIERQIANVTTLFPVQDIAYTWDAIGNLKTRRNYSGRTTQFSTANAIEETFCYDGLNRVTDIHSRTLNGNCAIKSNYYHHAFNSLGNITSKRDVGSYTYGQNNAGPHAVTRTLGRVSGTYTYDKNGNLTGDSNGRAVKYTPFDKPYEIVKSGEHTTRIYYGPNRERWKRIDKRKDGVDVTTLYFGSVERITKSNTNTVTWKRYLGSFAFYTIDTDSSGAPTSIDRAYLYKDYQGSTDVITNIAGTVITTMGFDVWGERRNAYNAGSLTGENAYKFVNQLILATEYIQDFTTQGYTGHEHLDEVGLIHMNGRVYDPTLGRFMSADILVDNVMDTQGYNRYSYVKNRPMFYTDPSGFESELCDGPEAAEGCGGETTIETTSDLDQTDPCGTGICSFITVGLHNEFPSDSGGVFGFSSSPDNVTNNVVNSEANSIDTASRESFGLCDFSHQGGCTTISFITGTKPSDVFKQIHDTLLGEYLERRQAAFERGELFDENNGSLGSVTIVDIVLPQAKVLKLGKGLAVAKGLAGVPGRVQSRINLQTGTNKFGMKHILKEHLSGKTNKSQFNLSEGGLKSLLQSKQVVNSPIVKTLQSKTHGTLYVRQVDVGRTIGTNYLKGNSATSMLTTQSDKFGNIVTAFPGL